MDNDIKYKIAESDPSLSDFVERFWILANYSESNKKIVVIPDGRTDIFFSYSAKEPFHAILLGLETKPKEITLPPQTVSFGISLKLFAVEYFLDINISDLLNNAQRLPFDFLGIKKNDLNDFDNFCNKISNKISELIKQKVDDRKQKLFELIYSSNGLLTVKELSIMVCWNSRQINRYFNKQFGISLKVYCKILRFRASFQHIKEGKLFPELNFTDQAHFINEVKKLSGATPKELYKNINDRFLQFSTIQKK